jgi:hypothetical protein
LRASLRRSSHSEWPTVALSDVHEEDNGSRPIPTERADATGSRSCARHGEAAGERNWTEGNRWRWILPVKLRQPATSLRGKREKEAPMVGF